jgi:hypothetical protein
VTGDPRDIDYRDDRDDRDFREVARLIENSRAWGVVAGAARVVFAARSDSRIAAAARRGMREFSALPSTTRANSLAVLLTTAAITHLALGTLIPPPSAPAAPPALWVVSAVVALAVAIGARALLKARRHSRPARSR